jgi:hypothetical protein
VITVTVGPDVVQVGAPAVVGVLGPVYSQAAAAPLLFRAGIFEAIDFGSNSLAALFWAGATGAQGAGIDQTIIRLKAMSSTRKGMVPSQPDKSKTDGSTNPLYLARWGSSKAGNVPQKVALSGFTAEGTDQGHIYNGLLFYYADDSTVDHVKLVGFPGDSSVNPGETFSFNVFRTARAVFTNTEFDGAGKSSSLLGLNFVNGFTIRSSSLHDAPLGAAITSYQAIGGVLEYTDVNTYRNPGVAFNFEGNGTTTPCVINITRCTMRDNIAANVIADAINVGSSSKITFTDCVYDGPKIRVTIHNTPGQRQLASDIRVIENGVDVTAQKLLIQRENVPGGGIS